MTLLNHFHGDPRMVCIDEEKSLNDLKLDLPTDSDSFIYKGSMTYNIDTSQQLLLRR